MTDGPVGDAPESPEIRRKAEAIYVRVQNLVNQVNASSEPPQIVGLDTKIDEYLMKIGYSNAQVLGIVLNLLTTGKVRIEFRTHIERLELVHQEDLMPSGAAGEVFDSYITAKKLKEKIQVINEFTGKIVIQPRKI